MLLVLGISKEDFTVFLNPCKPSRMVFNVCCNRVFYKFPGWFLLWTTAICQNTCIATYIDSKLDYYNSEIYLPMKTVMVIQVLIHSVPVSY